MSNARLGETQDRFDFVTGEWLGVIDQRGREVDVPSWNADGTLRAPGGGSVSYGGGKTSKGSGVAIKPWPLSILQYDGSGTGFANAGATAYGKMKCAGNPKRVRAILMASAYFASKSYSQTLTQITLTPSQTNGTVGIAVGDIIWFMPYDGLATAGWYPVESKTGTTVVVTSPVSQTTSGTCGFSRMLTGVKCSVALTEKSSYATAADLYTPYALGADHNASATTDMYGFYPIDFGAGGFYNNPNYLGSAKSPKLIGTFTHIPGFAASNWVALPSVISDDGKGGNFLFRVFKDFSATGSYSSIDAPFLTQFANAARRQASGVDSSPECRPYFQAVYDAVDGIVTPTTIPSAVFPTAGFSIAFEFDYGTDATGVAVFGDSTTAVNPFMLSNGGVAALSATFSGTTMTLNADTASSVGGAGGISVPIVLGQDVSYAGQTNNADGTKPFIVSLLSGISGKAGSTYQLSVAQGSSTASTTISGGSLNTWFSWAQKAVYEKSTVASPLEFFNGAFSGRTSEYYFQEIEPMLEAGIVPAVAFFQGYSVNDSGTPNDAILTIYRGRLLKAINKAKKAGVGKILVGTWPMTPGVVGGGATYTLMLAHNAWIKSLAASGVTDGCPDFDAVRVSMGTANFYSPDGSTALAACGDGIHQGRAAHVAMAAEFAKFI